MEEATAPARPPSLDTDAEVIARLLAGDEATFQGLVAAHHSTMLRVARGFVRADNVAEEVVQETWLAILNGLARFEGRSSLKTWMFRILANRARTRGKREARTVPMSALGDGTDDGPAVSPDRFDSSGGWLSPPAEWHDPSARVQSAELGRVLLDAIATLPPRQQTVITLRDVKGWSSEEVCNALDLSETNQRVLLHRARSKVRQALAPYMTSEP